MTLNATTTTTAIASDRSTLFPDALENLRSIDSPGGRSTAPTGALALVPPGNPGSAAALLKTFRAVAQQKGPAAAIESLLNTKAAGPLQALIKTPQGRTALAVAALGFSVGYVGGANAPKVQALVTALKSIADQNLPPARAAQQIAQVLRVAVLPAKAATPAAPDRTAANRQVQALTTSLKNAQADLKETRQLLRQRPGDQDLQTIAKGQTAKVRDLQAKVDALKPGRTVESAQLPTKLEELSPYLQDQVRNHGMKLTKAIAITNAERDRNPPKSCHGNIEVVHESEVNNGRISTETSVYLDILGSETVVSVNAGIKVTDPDTKKSVGSRKSGDVPGRAATIDLHTERQGVYTYPPKLPIVVPKGVCTHADGTKQPATFTESTRSN